MIIYLEKEYFDKCEIIAENCNGYDEVHDIIMNISEDVVKEINSKNFLTEFSRVVKEYYYLNKKKVSETDIYNDICMFL